MAILGFQMYIVPQKVDMVTYKGTQCVGLDQSQNSDFYSDIYE